MSADILTYVEGMSVMDSLSCIGCMLLPIPMDLGNLHERLGAKSQSKVNQTIGIFFFRTVIN